jgi:hypothetical protein
MTWNVFGSTGAMVLMKPFESSRADPRVPGPPDDGGPRGPLSLWIAPASVISTTVPRISS